MARRARFLGSFPQREKAVPVGKTLIAKAEPVTPLPEVGQWVWKIRTPSS
jgi:hypothetical protein